MLLRKLTLNQNKELDLVSRVTNPWGRNIWAESGPGVHSLIESTAITGDSVVDLETTVDGIIGSVIVLVGETSDRV